MANQPDLTQVAALFNDCIERIKNQTQEGNEKLVEDWLKEARHNIMQQIETKYYELAAAIEHPAQQPTWALDPSTPLILRSISHPAMMDPYSSDIINNLTQLLKDCGFTSKVRRYPDIDGYRYLVPIQFPQKLNNSPTQQISSIHLDSEADILGRMKRGLIQAGTCPANSILQSNGESSQHDV